MVRLAGPSANVNADPLVSTSWRIPSFDAAMLTAAERPLTGQVLKRQVAERRDGCHDPSKLGEPSHTTDDRIAGMRGSADIIEKFMSMVGAHRDAPVRLAGILPALLLFEQDRNQCCHVCVAAEMI